MFLSYTCLLSHTSHTYLPALSYLPNYLHTVHVPKPKRVIPEREERETGIERGRRSKANSNPFKITASDSARATAAKPPACLPTYPKPKQESKNRHHRRKTSLGRKTCVLEENMVEQKTFGLFQSFLLFVFIIFGGTVYQGLTVGCIYLDLYGSAGYFWKFR